MKGLLNQTHELLRDIHPHYTINKINLLTRLKLTPKDKLKSPQVSNRNFSPKKGVIGVLK